jgi:hypothetical protein
MIQETFVGKTVTKEEEIFLIKNLLALSKLAEKFPKILELDINPIMSGYIIDSRIVFEK